MSCGALCGLYLLVSLLASENLEGGSEVLKAASFIIPPSAGSLEYDEVIVTETESRVRSKKYQGLMCILV